VVTAAVDAGFLVSLKRMNGTRVGAIGVSGVESTADEVVAGAGTRALDKA
jgi:uncharacterized protein GlcG (DUF336 family)